MRRVLEAYSTFNYNLGPSEISTNQELLSKIKDKTEREFFKAYMYRLILNSDSHSSDRVRRSSSNYSEMFSNEEKRRTAQLLLGFLYRLDSFHIESMIDFKQFESFCVNYDNEVKRLKNNKYEEKINRFNNNINRIELSVGLSDDEKLEKSSNIKKQKDAAIKERESLVDYLESNKNKYNKSKEALQVGPMIERWLLSIK